MTEPAALAFMRDLWALDQALHVASKRMSVRLGVTGPQRLVIRLVGRHLNITPGELALRLHVHPSTLTDILHRLERDGLVRLRVDANDRRRIRIALTSAGRRVDSRTTDTIEAAIGRALARMSRADREAASRLHATITAELQAIAQKPSPGRQPATPRR